MKSINGIYHCQADSTDFLLKTPTFTGNASERTVTQLAKGGAHRSSSNGNVTRV